MDPQYAVGYRALHERHWWWRTRERRILRELRKHRPEGGYGAILDVGCGDGLFFDRLREFGEPEGVETDHDLITDAGRRAGRIHEQPFDERFDPGKSFGLVLMLDVIEHLEDDRAALRRAFELMDPGALLLVTVPAFEGLWTTHDDINHHLRRYRRSQLNEVIEGAGFEGVDSRYFFHWTAPVKLLVRAKEKLVQSEHSPLPGVPPAPINGLLIAATELEAHTLGLLRPPFGSSILATAHRPR